MLTTRGMKYIILCLICLFSFSLLQGGMFVLQLFDNYAATYSLLFIGLVECVVLAWVYGKLQIPLFSWLKVIQAS